MNFVYNTFIPKFKIKLSSSTFLIFFNLHGLFPLTLYPADSYQHQCSTIVVDLCPSYAEITDGRHNNILKEYNMYNIIDLH